MSGPRDDIRGDGDLGPEDSGSRTVEDAASFEGWRSEHYDPPDDDGPSLADYPEMEDPGDECGCSDPGCPCGGPKRGGSP